MNKESLQPLSLEILKDVTDETDRAFAQELIRRVLANIEDLDERIIQRVTNWEMNRIALIDKILLRMGICELLHFPDIPPKVSINEAIEISKDYSTAGSAKFINGILDAILAEEKKEGKLNKTGRGLVEESISPSRQ
jgi:N utilization substance protein B